MSEDRSIARLTTIVAAASATLIAFGAPLTMYQMGKQSSIGAIEAEAKFFSKELSQMIGLNPLMWRFEEDRHLQLLNDPGHSYERDTKEITDLEGKMITRLLSVHGEPTQPVISVSQPLFDSGNVVGHITIHRSLTPLARNSLILLLFTTPLGIGIFIATRSMPLRLMNKAIGSAAFLASHDPLTKLPNRGLFNEWLDDAVNQTDVRSALLLVDLDRFKQVNDTFGHPAGDALLIEAAERMQKLLSGKDILARLGGDEFAVLLIDVASEDTVRFLADKLISDVSETYVVNGHSLNISASIGISFPHLPEPADASTVFQRADLALYRAKSLGRSTFSFFSEDLAQQLKERKELEEDLARALERDEVRVCYQPQVSRSSYQLVGVEALARWRHPEKGEISPSQFIPIAEESGLIVALGKSVINRACQDAAQWPGLKVAVNVSPAQFKQSELIEIVSNALETSGLPAERLELEITENLLLENTDSVIKTLEILRDMGVSVAMDDFGTGYSSLSYLSRFPFDKIKIDRSFICNIGIDEKTKTIIDAIAVMGKALGMRLNAEGVERSSQAVLLDRIGYDEFQGFLFSAAVEKSKIDEFLAQPKLLNKEIKSLTDQTLPGDAIKRTG
ncbi:MAG: EAL domain-containing protein [Paracoccaceae bacterium]|nr:EAL domain-containing protein [Paracoccaceae bacterium]